MVIEKYNYFNFDETFLKRLKTYCEENRVIHNCKNCMFLLDQGMTKTCRFREFDGWCKFWGVTGEKNEKIKLGFTVPS